MGTFFQKVGSLIGSASGSAAGSLVKDLADGVGQFINTPADKEAAQKYLLDNANTVQAEMDKHSELVLTAAEKEHEAEMSDIQSARENQTAVSTSDKSPLINKLTLPLLALVVTAGFFGILAYMLKYDVPPANKDILNIILGSLGTAWVSIVSYYFGSSRGSDDKNETIKTLASGN